MFRLANFLELVWKRSGVAPELRARGLDANININLVPKGTGCVQINGGPCLEDLFPLRVTVTDLSSAQLATLTSNPPVFVPAPGPGIGLAFVAAYALATAGTIPFFNSSIDIGYNGDTTALEDTALQMASGSLDNVFTQTGINGTALSPAPVIANTALVGINGSADDPGGAIGANALNTGGAGYAALDTFTVDIGNVLATGVVDTVDGGGAVLTYHLTSFGSGYVPTVGQTTTATSGGGAGLTIDISTIVPNNGTARVWVVYFPIVLP